MRPGRFLAIIMPPALPAAPLPARLVPALVLAYACLLPRELALEVGGAVLPPYRLALFALVPFIAGNLARYPVRPSWIDLCALFASVWFVVALSFSTSADAAVFSGGALGLDFMLAYLAGRSSLHTAQDWRTLFTLLIPGLAGVALVLAAESLSHRFILRPGLAMILERPPPLLNQETRYGLLRATGPFPHPILAGIFLASAVPLAWFMTRSGSHRIIALAAAGLGAIFTVSSAAVLGLAIAFGLIAAQIFQRLTRFPIFLAAGFFLLLALPTIALVSERGLIPFLIRRLTFDAHNAYYRLGIWEYGSAEVARSPWFGIGQNDWIRPLDMTSASVDSYWLVLAMTYGLPMAIAVGLALGGAGLALVRTQRWRADGDRGVASALLFLFLILIFSGFTVHFWEGLHAWMLMVVGGATSLSSQAWLAARWAVPGWPPRQDGAGWPQAQPGAASL